VSNAIVGVGERGDIANTRNKIHMTGDLCVASKIMRGEVKCGEGNPGHKWSRNFIHNGGVAVVMAVMAVIVMLDSEGVTMIMAM
jgi:hypothetical protein